MDTASTSLVTVNFLPAPRPQRGVTASPPAKRFAEQRLSPRVTLASPLPCFVSGLGPAAFHGISLGGATIVSSGRPRSKSSRVRLVYGDACVDTKLDIYRTVLHELFYSALGSRVRYLSCARFDNPSVAALNLLYRILADHWVDSGDDDTTPFEPERTTSDPAREIAR